MITSVETLLSWIAIGLGASIAAWTWPFRRGVSGLVLNAVAAVAGAVGLGLLGHLFGLDAGHAATRSLIFAALGAVGALLLAHLLWAQFTARVTSIRAKEERGDRRPSPGGAPRPRNERPGRAIRP